MALISQNELEARLGRSLTSEEASAFTLINSAVQAHIEKLIGSSVESEDIATRYYDGGVQNLPIDPCTGITAVAFVDENENVQSTYDESEYTLEPRNRTLKQMVRRRGGVFSHGFNNIAVTAKFSIYDDEDTRNVVKDAMLDALESEINNNSNIKRESIEGYSVEFATTETKNALDKIKLLFPEIL